MPKLVWMNGEIFPLEEAKVNVADHAHLYGDGLFEGIRIYNRKVFKLDEHLTRLYQGANYLNFQMKISKSELCNIVLETCFKADLDNGYIRLNVTRGTGLGLDPKGIDNTPNVMVMVSTLALYPPESYEKGLTVVTVPQRVLPADALDPRVKCIGTYAANILAKLVANRAGAGEGLMLTEQGHLAECTGDNIFLVQDKEILTPHPSCGILKGITRNTVIELAQEAGYNVKETFLTPFDVFCSNEAFLTGTAAEIIPMVELDGRPIETGHPGPITKHLMTLFKEHTALGTSFEPTKQTCC